MWVFLYVQQRCQVKILISRCQRVVSRPQRLLRTIINTLLKRAVLISYPPDRKHALFDQLDNPMLTYQVVQLHFQSLRLAPRILVLKVLILLEYF